MPDEFILVRTNNYYKWSWSFPVNVCEELVHMRAKNYCASLWILIIHVHEEFLILLWAWLFHSICATITNKRTTVVHSFPKWSKAVKKANAQRGKRYGTLGETVSHNGTRGPWWLKDRDNARSPPEALWRLERRAVSSFLEPPVPHTIRRRGLQHRKARCS